jgi:prepilin-type N-terminal cleavage/methylation domain-containing protein
MGKKLQEGFTLVELLVGLMVVSIALGVGIPATNDLLANSRMANAVNDLVSTLYFARSQALSFGVPVTVCASRFGTACDGARLVEGWMVFRDDNGDGQFNGAPETIFASHAALADNILHNPKTTSGNTLPQYLFFGRDGRPGATALGPATTDLQLCDERGARDMGNGLAAGRWIRIQPNGQPLLVDQLAEIQANPHGGC